MAKMHITDFVIYRWRYVIGYALIGVLLITSLYFATMAMPGGLSQDEMNSTVISASIDFQNLASVAVIDLPYHLLQRLSIDLLGVSVLGVKLPSLFIGLLTAVGLMLLLRQWFRYNVAVLAAVIAISTSQFLFIAQNGTPIVMYLFWSVWLLLSATMIARRTRPVLLWRILFFALTALSLYTPLSVYVLIAITTAVILHPHLRYLFWRIPTADIAVSSLLGSLLLIPLGYTIATNPDSALSLLGFTNIQPDLLDGAKNIFTQLFDFAGSKVADSGMILPLFSLGSMMLIGLGVFSMIRARHSVKTYLIVLWTIMLIPAITSEPSYIIIAFVPMVLLLASGLSYLFDYWYGLFPKNPYARIAGLLPLVVLVGGLVLSGLDRYSYSYTYAGAAVTKFTDDISLLHEAVKNNDTSTVVVVSPDELAFYKAATARMRNNVTTVSAQPDLSNNKIIVSGLADNAIPEGKELDRILTSPKKAQSDRFYVYKNPRT